MNDFLAVIIRRLLPALLAVQTLVLGSAEPLPAGWNLERVTTVNPGSIYAVDTQGQAVAFIRDGLWIRDLGPGTDHAVQAETPVVLAWSQQGARLAAAFMASTGTSLRLFSRSGDRVGETHLAGRVTALAWRGETELLALVVEGFPLRFGTRLTETLARWDGHGEATLLPLEDATLMPARMAQWERRLPMALGLALSPLGDEILYTRINATPAIPPSLKLMLRHLEHGQGRTLAEVSLMGSNGVFSGDGRCILYGDGVGQSFFLNPWEGKAPTILAEPGRSVALSPSGRIALLDGQVYQDGQRVGALGAMARGQFAAHSGALFVEEEGQLFRVVGLPAEPLRPLSAIAADELQQSRKRPRD